MGNCEPVYTLEQLEKACEDAVQHYKDTCVSTQPRETAYVSVCTSLSRTEFHSVAWANYYAKCLDDKTLTTLNIHSLRTIFDAIYDAIPKQQPSPTKQEPIA